MVFVLLVSLAKCVTFECRFYTSYWTYIGDSYSCIVNVKMANSETILESVEGNHLSEKSASDVFGLQVIGQPLTQMPRNIENFFANIKGLMWTNSKLNFVSASDLQSFPKLVYLSFGLNKIITLDGDLFNFTPQLKLINFGSNAITTVGPNLLSNLNALKVADFLNNPCVNVRAITSDAIKKLNVELPVKCSPSLQLRLQPMLNQHLIVLTYAVQRLVRWKIK